MQVVMEVHGGAMEGQLGCDRDAIGMCKACGGEAVKERWGYDGGCDGGAVRRDGDAVRVQWGDDASMGGRWGVWWGGDAMHMQCG